MVGGKHGKGNTTDFFIGYLFLSFSHRHDFIQQFTAVYIALALTWCCTRTEVPITNGITSHAHAIKGYWRGGWNTTKRLSVKPSIRTHHIPKNRFKKVCNENKLLYVWRPTVSQFRDHRDGTSVLLWAARISKSTTPYTAIY